MDECKHENEIVDQHEGSIICTDCGLVKDQYFKNEQFNYDSYSISNPLSLVENILEQLHLPLQFTEIITNNLDKSHYNTTLPTCFETKTRNYNIKKIMTMIYNTINDKNSNILLKEISNFSKLSSNQIKSKDISIVNIEDVLERYTKRFNIDFNDNTLIKEEVLKYVNTGFQPLTIIGGVIYDHFLKIKLRKSMKKIAQILGISSISIQRFLKYKNEISSRC
jgi:transcription initiation factor TFIIIB Brf1 subunit/transcription initiation factor TFIIB